jgi:hypothetical protein
MTEKCAGEEISPTHSRESNNWKNNNSYFKFCWTNKSKIAVERIDDSYVLHLFWFKNFHSSMAFVFHDPQCQQM